MLKRIPALLLVLMIGAIGVFAQDVQIRTLTNGQKYKIKGVVIAKDDTSFVMRDLVGVDTKVVITSATSIKTKGNIFGGGKATPASAIVRGLNLEVEGIGNSEGNLVAAKIRFDKDDLAVARSIDSRVTPTEERITRAEQNAERVSGQIDELMAVSNAARGGAKAAQDTADAAVTAVNATNQRITALDDYVVQSTAVINFRTGSYALSPEAKSTLDQIAQASMTLRGYIIEVTGFTDSTGSPQQNKILSQRRAQAVIDYLVETHNIPLRRIGVSYGFGENQAVGDNRTNDGRAQNRRVEIKLMVNRGLNQNVEVRTNPTSDQ